MTVKGLVFTPKVYYVPFSPSSPDQEPIWRDFATLRICTALDGVEDIQDDFKKALEGKEPDTKCLEIGNDSEKILVGVYRPILVRELSQKKSDAEESSIISYHELNENIQIPLINCEQFSVRDFSENGVKEYQVKSRETVYYNFPTLENSGFDPKTEYTRQEAASRLTPEIPLDYLKIYISKLEDSASDLYFWNYKDDPRPVANANDLKEAGVVFQSLKDNDSPRHYICPTFKTNESDVWGDDDDDDVWGDDDDSDSTSDDNGTIDMLRCFKTIAEHKTYFFLFTPMIECVSKRNQVKEILIPLLKERNYELTEDDIKHLYLFALQFHFDWMLLPRDLWKKQIAESSQSEAEQENVTNAVIDFFCRTPKATDEREKVSLHDFVKRYWTFDNYPKVDSIAETALQLILDKPDALNKIGEMKNFLKVYDECRFKFIEKSKAIISIDNI